MQIIYTVFLTDVDGSMRGESLGLSEQFVLLVLEPIAKPTILKSRCHQFLAEVRFAISQFICLKSNGSIFPGVLVYLHFVQTPHSVPKLKKSKR